MADKTFKLFQFDPKIFWDLYSSMKGETEYFDKDFKDLMEKMLSYLPVGRLSLEKIKLHPYMLGETATEEEIMQEFTERRERNK